MTYEIRAEARGDEATIHAVTRAAFLDVAHADHTQQAIVDALREDGALAISLVAQRDGRVVGHVAVSRVTTAGGQVAGWYGLGPISVLPECQRQGIGSSLMRAALSELHQRGAAGCILVGDPAYYGRFGFGPAAPLVFPSVPPVCFQAVANRGEVPAGTVQYHAAFDARARDERP